MVEVSWTPLSLNDIQNIAEFISKDSEKYARIQVQRFFDYAGNLENNVHAGRIVPEIGNESIRELILGNYRIIYRIVNQQRVDILTVHHSSRLLSNNPTFDKPI